MGSDMLEVFILKFSENINVGSQIHCVALLWILL